VYFSGRGVPLDPSRAEKYLKKAAASGHAKAKYLLLVLTYRKSKDGGAFVKALRALSQDGVAEAQFALAGILQEGRLAPKDLKAALSLNKSAAERGSADAANNLGAMYDHGWGADQDY